MKRMWLGGLGFALVTALEVQGVWAEAPPSTGPKQVLAVEPADPPYDPSGRRDPFRPPSAGASRQTGEPQTPLQRYEVGQLKLVAIIYDTREPRAVLEDDEGIGYIVKTGTPIGLNDGKVRTIERGRLVIEENSIDFYGERRPNDVVLELRTAEAERGK
jgi:type IV pilus assembly protein PilP